MSHAVRSENTMMQFRNLPDEFHIGSMAVQPRSPLCFDLKPCQSCHCVSTDFMKCAQAHVTCQDCVLVKVDCKSDDSDQQLHIWCVACNKQVPAIRTVLSHWFLQMLKFACPCNYSGTLDKIKKHLNSMGNRCLGKNRARRESLSATAIRNMHDVDSKLQLVEEKSNEFEESLRSFRQELDSKNGVINACKQIPSKLATVCGSRGMIFFNFVKNSDSDWMIETPSNQRYYISGLPLFICPAILLENSKQWLTISIGPAPKTESGRERHYKMKIVVRVHNARGGSVTTIEKATCRKGKYIHPCFEHNDNNLYDMGRIFCLDRLIKDEILLDGQLCLSFELVPLQDE